MTYNDNNVREMNFDFEIKKHSDINKFISKSLIKLKNKYKNANIENIITNVSSETTTYQVIENTTTQYLSVYIIFSINKKESPIY